MKKIERIIICILIIASLSLLCGCGNNRTLITIANYSKYLDIKGGAHFTGAEYGNRWVTYKSVNCRATIEGLSTYFYSDVVVTLLLTVHTDYTDYTASTKSSIEIVVPCNGRGNASIDKDYSIDDFSKLRIEGRYSFYPKGKDGPGGMFDEVEVTVLSVTGYVERA